MTRRGRLHGACGHRCRPRASAARNGVDRVLGEFHTFVARGLGPRVFGFDAAAASVYGEMVATRERGVSCTGLSSRRSMPRAMAQSLGAVMGMDWHSSGITTSVLGTLKRGLAPLLH